jgi:hypothetical protein
MDNKEEVKVEQTPQTTQQNPEISPENEINWKKFREERAEERKKTQELQVKAKQKEEEAEALKAALEAVVQKPSRNDSNESEESEDDRIQKKIDAALAAERNRQDILSREREAKELPQRLLQMHPDFNDVCTQENLDYLEYHHPEIAAAFQAMPEGLNKWTNVYKAMKKLVSNPNSSKDQKKAEKNFNKPQSMSVAGVTQTGDTAPQILDDKRRADNWARMQRVMKGGK